MGNRKVHISALPKDGFWRCGRQFSHAGAVFDESDFSDEEKEILAKEPKLRVRPATDEDGTFDEERRAKIAEAIEGLTPDDFQNDGKPKLNSINTLLGKEFGAKVSGNERDSVWEAMMADGFEAPVAA